jgi:transcriptional regulator with XRE-family HTH domain
MARNFSVLRARMSPEAQARSQKRAERYREEMALDELREARELTQNALAEILNVKQSAISKLERRTDMYVSTLRNIVKGMGGELKIEAVFPDGKVAIKRFRSFSAKKAPSSKNRKAAG